MTDQSPRFIADVTLYPAEQGGRGGPTPPDWFGCPCKAAMDAVQAWDCRIMLSGRAMKPGETRRVEIMFLSPDEAVPAFRKADKFFLWEGRVIGEGKLV
jgi:hypothetical protein